MEISIDTKSQFVAFVAIFTALAVVLDSIPIVPGFYSGVWDSWLFLISPLLGILLGPVVGAVSTLLGSFIGHLIYFRDPFELIFMFGAQLGAFSAGMVYRYQWKPVLVMYSGLLLGYFLTPVSWQLSLWGIWDVVVGFIVILVGSLFTRSGRWPLNDTQTVGLRLILATIIGLETDILLRIFILVPCQAYWIFYGFTVEQLQILWLGAGFITPLKVLMATLVGTSIGLYLKKVFGKTIQLD
ncbi:MAG: hypothetical protein JW779_08965 [Candidatus Thorarchaeota archaeon]|nr:hypothetical protein [Candidatus Thorarchaeota archaeon]